MTSHLRTLPESNRGQARKQGEKAKLAKARERDSERDIEKIF